MTKIILTRHGHVAGLEPERFRGRIELALTDEGLRQAKRTAAHIAAIWTPAAIYSSPLQRCLATVAEISRACGRIKVVALKGLNDLDYGAWQWRTHEDVEAEDPVRFNHWRSAPHLIRFPQGEALQDLVVKI